MYKDSTIVQCVVVISTFCGNSTTLHILYDCYYIHTQGRTVMHTAAEKGSCKACEVILNLRLDAVYDTDKKVPLFNYMEGSISFSNMFHTAENFDGRKS